MKKLLIPALGLILLGQGCFAPAPTDEPSPPDAMSDTTIPVPAPGFEGVDEMIVNDDGDAMTEDDAKMDDDKKDTDAMEGALNMDIETDNFFFSPDIITAAPGQTVTLTVAKNNGFHTFMIEAIDFKQRVNEGDTITFTAPSEPGEYPYYCDIGNHRALGMEGTLIVR